MSSSIWTRCAGASRLRPFAAQARRVVESQHQVATRKLVDTNAEQALLEELIEGAKPPDPTGGRLHYLLSTPFRYPPLAHGSRFGTRVEPGVWYGAAEPRTCFAETAYYRLLFLEGTDADLGTVETPLTLFSVTVRGDRGVDLTVEPFDGFRSSISSRTRYAASQALGGEMREAGVQFFRYTSARDRERGVAVGVFTPDVFGRRRPRQLEDWHCTAQRERVEVRRRDYFEEGDFSFPREDFLVKGRLPWPAP